MSTLFFLMALLFAWSAWNLYHPNFNNEKFAIIIFLAGWLTGELAVHFILIQAILVAVFVLFGATSGFFGALGFLICVGSWVAMALHYHQSFGSEAEVATALRDGLGEDYLSEINENLRQHFPSGPDIKLIRWWMFRREDPLVETIKDISYGDFDQKLDIRRSRQLDDDGKRPVLLQIHGGGWTKGYGSKNEQAIPLMNHMAKRDWVCVAISYRLCPGATFPEHIIDCKQALVWIKDHIAEYGGDPNFVVVTGGSAGGHLSALMALSANYPAFQPGFEDRDTRLQGAVPFYGVYDFTDSHHLQRNKALIKLLESSMMKLPLDKHEKEFQEASPLFHINKDAPPCLIVHGTHDTLIPVEVGRMFSEEMCKVSNSKVVYMEFSGAQHAFDMFPSIRSEQVKHGVERFLAWTYSQHLKVQNTIRA